MITVYLSGPITGKTFKEAEEKRLFVAEQLRAAGFRVLDPLRGKSYVLSHQRKPIKEHDAKKNPTLSDKALKSRDKLDTLSCEIVLADFSEPAMITVEDILHMRGISVEGVSTEILEAAIDLASIGSIFEVAWAEDHNKLVVAVIPAEHSVHNHAFVRESAVIYETLEEAVRYIISCGVEEIKRD